MKYVGRGQENGDCCAELLRQCRKAVLPQSLRRTSSLWHGRRLLWVLGHKAVGCWDLIVVVAKDRIRLGVFVTISIFPGEQGNLVDDSSSAKIVAPTSSATLAWKGKRAADVGQSLQ